MRKTGIERAFGAMWTPLSETVRRRDDTCDLAEFVDDLHAGRTPCAPPHGCSPYGDCYQPWSHELWKARELSRNLGMWGIVYARFADDIAQLLGRRRVLEVMSGRGWLARALHERGVDIVATDDHSWRRNFRYKGELLYDVHEASASDAVRAHGSAEVLLCQWPYMEPAFAAACALWGSERPIVYIGEGEGGCTADETFFDGFCEDESINVELLTWPGVHDHVEVGCWKDRR